MIWLALGVIVITLIGVAIGRFPRLHMNRATIALVGATLLVALCAIPLDAAYAALDMDTLVLLFAMMVINVNLRLAGFFRLVGSEVIRLARTPRQLLALIVVSSGVLSAIFLNDTVVLMLTPLVLDIALALQRNPIPYLIGLATAANIGSAATIVGNPQNMIIGVSSQIPFTTFTGRLAPASLVGLAVAWGVVTLVYREEFAAGRFPAGDGLPREAIYRPLLHKGMLASAIMLVAFVAGAPVPLAALVAAALLLVTRRIKPQRVFNEVDPAGLGGQPDRRGDRQGARGAPVIRGVLEGRRADHPDQSGHRRAVADCGAVGPVRRPGGRKTRCYESFP